MSAVPRGLTLAGWTPEVRTETPNRALRERARLRGLAETREMLGLRSRMKLSAVVDDVFGRLTVVKMDGIYRDCRCECGRMRRVEAWELVGGRHRGEDWRVTACEWCMQVARVEKRGQVVRSEPTRPVTAAVVREIQSLRGKGLTLRAIASRPGLNYGMVWRVLHGK